MVDRLCARADRSIVAQVGEKVDVVGTLGQASSCSGGLHFENFLFFLLDDVVDLLNVEVGVFLDVGFRLSQIVFR